MFETLRVASFTGCQTEFWGDNRTPVAALRDNLSQWPGRRVSNEIAAVDGQLSIGVTN